MNNLAGEFRLMYVGCICIFTIEVVMLGNIVMLNILSLGYISIAENIISSRLTKIDGGQMVCSP